VIQVLFNVLMSSFLGRSACRGGYEFYPKDYGVHGMWVILTPPATEPPHKMK
jgi:hypothetical protein